MNDISKFNNQYLKCIVTKYDSTVNAVNGYLANSGALIVYHPESETDTYTTIINGEEINTKYNRNYVYLGNEFLASGYGFLCKDMRDDAEKIVRNYDRTIKDIKDTIQNEKNDRISGDRSIREELNNYIKTNGFIDNTKVNINGKVINTKDLLLHGEEAKYENLEITNINIKINDNNVSKFDGNNIYLPLGIAINSIEIEVEYNINDSGGIYKLEVLHKYDAFSSLNIDEKESIQSVVIKYDQDNNGNATEGTIKYKRIFKDRTNLNIITKDIQDFIQGFYIYVKETPIEKYKNYPRIKEYFDIEIPSTGNIIKNNVIQLLKHINIIPLYSIHYIFSHAVNNYSDIKENFEKQYKLIDNANEIKIDNIPHNNANSTPNNIFYFAIPSIYSINKVYAVDDQNIKYNWTGSIFISSVSNKLLTYKNTDNENICICNYNFYRLITSNGFNKCKQIIIYVSLIEDNITYDNDNDIKLTNESNNELNNVSFEFKKSINDEDFNNLYWVSFKNNDTVLLIKNTLDPLNNKCT